MWEGPVPEDDGSGSDSANHISSQTRRVATWTSSKHLHPLPTTWVT